MVLYNKLYNIDKLGHKKHLKKLKPIFQYKQNTMGGYKKHEIIRVAQEMRELLFIMLKNGIKITKHRSTIKKIIAYILQLILIKLKDMDHITRIGDWGLSKSKNIILQEKNFSLKLIILTLGLGIILNLEEYRIVLKREKDLKILIIEIYYS